MPVGALAPLTVTEINWESVAGSGGRTRCSLEHRSPELNGASEIRFRSKVDYAGSRINCDRVVATADLGHTITDHVVFRVLRSQIDGGGVLMLVVTARDSN